MKSKRSQQKTAEKRVDRRGGYQLTRDKDGLTPMQRLAARKADLAEIEIAEKLGNLVSKEHVEAGLREGGQPIGDDRQYVTFESYNVCCGSFCELDPRQGRVSPVFPANESETKTGAR